ncbi:MAG: 2'-5' RNA ligase family protein [Candidatus Limnocylindrales bacterium]
MESAIVVPVALPVRLERLRRERVAVARLGVPAHVTLLYPFLTAERLDGSVRRRLARIVAGRVAWDFSLTTARRWPDALVLDVDPRAPFVRLKDDLLEAYPDFQPYGGGVPYEPHVTIAEPDATGGLPRPPLLERPLGRRVERVAVIALAPDGRWHRHWNLALGGA